MPLRVIWQYMDRSVTKKILYGPQKLPYDPQCHELFAIYEIIQVELIYVFVYLKISEVNFVKVH